LNPARTLLFSRAHVVVRAEGVRTFLEASDTLRGWVGTVVTIEVGVGARIAAGQAFAMLEGSEQACRLYAPFACVVVAVTTLGIEVAHPEAPSEPLLSASEYASYAASLPKR
jgi:glycine cleavage system H lipoate-binding protein